MGDDQRRRSTAHHGARHKEVSMRLSKQCLLVTIGMVLSANSLLSGTAYAEDWRTRYPEITLGVTTAENEADRITRYQPVRAYLQRVLGVEIKWRTATDYAGIIEGVKAKKIEIAR